MSTTRLFDQDAYLGEFEATVERSVCEGGMYRVLLDQTAFFPEGGGQPADEGTLDGIFVTDVQEIDGEIWHTVEAPLEPGKTVVGKLDFEKRFFQYAESLRRAYRVRYRASDLRFQQRWIPYGK